MSWRKLTVWVLGGIVLVVTVGTGALLGTGAGLRWLYGVAEPYLPAPLSIEGLEGSVLGGLRAGRVSWADDRVTVRASNASAHVALMPLLDRQVRIASPRIESLSVEIVDREPESDPGREPPVVGLPIDLRLSDAIISDISVTIGATDSRFDRRIERLALTGRWTETRLRLDTLDIRSEWLALAVSGRARLEPPYASSLDGDWSIRQSNGDSWNGSLSLEGDWTDYRVRHELRAPEEIRSEGTLMLEDFDGSVDLTHRWTRIETVLADRALSLAEGRLRTAGNLDRYDAELQTLADVDGFPQVVASIAVSGDREGMEITDSSFETDPAGLSASGRVGWTGPATWALDVDLRRFDPAFVIDAAEGELRAGGRVEGIQRGDGAFDVDLRVDTLVGRLNQFPVTGSGSATLRANRFDALMATVGIGENGLRVEGRMQPELDLEVSLNAPALDQLEPGLDGSLALDARIEGPAADPFFEAKATSTGIRWNELTADRLAIGLGGRMDSHRITLTTESRGATVELDAGGSLRDRRWDGRLRSMTLSGDQTGEWSLEGDAKLGASAAELSVADYCIGRRDIDGNLCFDLDYDLQAKDLSATFDSRGVPVSTLLAAVSDEVQARGTLATTGELYLSDTRLDGSLRMAVEGGGLTAQYEGELLESRFEQAELTASIVDGRLDGQAAIVLGDGLGQLESTLTAANVRDPETPIDAALTVAVEDLTSLALFIPDMSRPAGRLDGTLTAGGTVAEPDFEGSLSLSGGRFEVPAAGITVEDVDVELFQTRLDELSIRGSARSGPGVVTLAGNLDFRTPTGARTELRVTGDNVELLRIPDREITASPDLRLVLDERLVELTGSIRIPSANFVVNELPETARSASPDAVVHREDQALTESRRYSIDVRTELGEDVRIAGFGLTTNVEGALQVTSGSGSVVSGNGQLRLVGGRYNAYGQDLTIEQGELLFNGPLDRPELSIRATRSVDTVTAGVQLTGTPDQLTSTVFSDPAMSDAEALSYLLTGRPLSRATAGEGNTLNEAAFALGLSQAGAVTSQIQNTLGLDSLTLEGGVDSGRIVAGRRVGGRLFVEYGYGLVDQLGTLLLRLQLTDNIVVESSSGSTTTLNVVYSITKE